MFDLVNCNAGTIQVKELPEGKCVCIACRGFGTMWHRVYWNRQALNTGGIYMIGEQRTCQKCSGIGHWIEPLRKGVLKLL